MLIYFKKIMNQNYIPTPTGVPTDETEASPSFIEKYREVISTLIIIVVAPIIALLITMFVFQSYEVDGPSMNNTLHNNDRLLVNKLPRTWAKLSRHSYIPNRYDIVIFNHKDYYDGVDPTNKQLVKRVIGLPGERVTVKNGSVIVYNPQNPKGFEVDKVPQEAKAAKVTPGDVDVTVGKNQVFLMGDNRPESLDSRAFGPVNAKDLVGKLVFRIYPFSQFTRF